MELSIDTSTRYASVALSRQGVAVVELTWRSEQNHSVELAPAIREVMGRARVGMDSLDAIFVAKGPGGFSALRVGMSTAKAMALALDVPLASVATLDIEAQPYLDLGMAVCALIDAGRGRAYAGRYGASEASGEAVYEVVSHQELAAPLGGATLFCGEGVGAIAGLLRESHGDSARLAVVTPPTRRAAVLAHLGYRRWQGVGADDPTTLQPLYLRSAQVEVAQRRWATT